MIKDNLRNARENLGISKAEAARRLKIPYSTYNSYETGRRKPGAEHLPEIAKVFSVPVSYLHHGVDKEMMKEHFKELQREYREKTEESAKRTGENFTMLQSFVGMLGMTDESFHSMRIEYLELLKKYNLTHEKFVSFVAFYYLAADDTFRDTNEHIDKILTRREFAANEKED